MSKSKRSHQPKNPWITEFDDLVRGASGGFLFGIPLLYTMEVWWIGSYTQPSRLLVAIASSLIVVFLLIRTEGFRKTKNIKFVDAVTDSIEALAIGILCTTSLLILLRQITLATPLIEALGKIIFEGMPFAIGVALAGSLLKGNYQSSNTDERESPDTGNPTINATIQDVGATLIGATLIAFNIAPTDEIPMLAAASSPPWLLAIMAVSLLISYGIVFEAGFTNQQKRMQQQGIFQRPLSETVMSYLVSLTATAFMLWFFHQLSLNDPWQMWLSHTILLGLPATIGGAAGRLVA
jgi:putative integral membrane protein (TIGR02587 family)